MITVTGSLAFDHIMDFPGKFSDHIMPDKIHQINLSFLVNTLQKQRGGNAGNIAFTLALLKTPVSILGMVGSDFSEYAKFLEKSGVDVSGIKTSQTALTSSAFIMTDHTDNQIAAFYPGAMSENSSLSLSDAKVNFAVISPNDPRAMVKFTKECQEFNIPYMLDPGMQLPVLTAEDLKMMISKASILIANDYEIALLSEKLKVKSEKLVEYVEILITTLGEKGSLIQTKDQKYEIGVAKPDQVLDPTGAGDAYRSGFLAGYMKKLNPDSIGVNLKTCGQMGAVASCYAIEKYGTTSHKFSVEEFKNRYFENFGEKLEL